MKRESDQRDAYRAKSAIASIPVISKTGRLSHFVPVQTFASAAKLYPIHLVGARDQVADDGLLQKETMLTGAHKGTATAISIFGQALVQRTPAVHSLQPR